MMRRASTCGLCLVLSVAACEPEAQDEIIPVRQQSSSTTAERVPASPMGWRCTGQGLQRMCVDRTRQAPPFACTGNHCEQAYPRMPDASDWSCAAQGGVVICLGGSTAAGVAVTPEAGAEAGWICGARTHGPQQIPQLRQQISVKIPETICIDQEPDFPDGNPRGWRCKYRHDPDLARICERDADVHVWNETCDRSRPCVDGSTCVNGSCVLWRPVSLCWLDADCASGRCLFGRCPPDEGPG